MGDRRADLITEGLLVVAAGAAGGGVAGWIVRGSISPDVTTAVATVVLVAVTAAYVMLVKGQLDVAVRQAEEHERRRVRDFSDAAALVALEALYQQQIRPGDGGEVDAAAARAASHALEQRAPFVETGGAQGADMADRMRATNVLLWLLTIPVDRLAAHHGVDRGRLSTRTRWAVAKCEESLQMYVRGDQLPAWRVEPDDESPWDLPRRDVAHEWAQGTCGLE